MPLFLLIAGAILALLGVGSIAAGAPDWALGLSIGATLITSGTIALVGGLILIGLSQVLTTLLDVQRRLELGAPAPSARPAIAPPEDRPQARGPRPQPPAETGEGSEPPRARRAPREPQPEPAGEEQPSREGVLAADQPRPRRERPREAPAEEIARPRRPGLPQPPSEEMLRRRGPAAPPPFEGEEQPARLRPRNENPREEIPRLRGDRPREQKSDEPREFAPIPSVPQPFSGEGRRGAPPPASAPEPAAEPEPYIPKFRPAEPAAAPARGQGSETVVRSGVIGGMAYTLYADGSIEAELPIGTVRFNSIAELQDHVMRTGAEADGDFSDPTR